MTETTMTGVLSWEHIAQDIPAAGVQMEQSATAEELAGLAEALDLVACESLSVKYGIVPIGQGRFRLAGSLTAQVRQSCVVTLEPITGTIAETFEFEFWPAADMPAPASGELDLSDEPDPEPIADGQIDVGRIVFECLAGAIDPFPRKPDAMLDRRSAGPRHGEESTPESPFAVLAQLKQKS